MTGGGGFIMSTYYCYRPIPQHKTESNVFFFLKKIDLILG